MRILIVEDEVKIASFMRKALEAEYFAVDVAHDGESGMKLSRENEYDLLILDNILPKKTGFDVCREIRAAGKLTPILVVSVKTDCSHKIDFLDAGADDYLIKPFAIAELIARIRALLRRPKTLTDDILAVGDLELDSKRYVVTRKGRPVRLTRKEFMLLRYLMQNQGIVLSRGMLLEHVWDMSADIFSNTIDAHILSLRKKLGDTKKEKLIQTVSGRGYKIDYA